MNNFIVLAELRSGYQMLATSLNTNSNIFCFGEIFGNNREIRTKSLFNQPVSVIEEHDDPINYVRFLNLFGVRKKVNALGFKLNYVDANGDNWKNLWNYIIKNKWKIIHLQRKNLLNRLISQRLAEKENNWSQSVYNSQVTISPSDLFISSEISNNYRKDARLRFKDNDVLDVFYEEMQSNPMKIFSDVQAFLNVTNKKLSINTIKQQNRRQKDVIENYDELFRITSETKPELLCYFEGSSLL